jgi:hypothetical protein
MTEASSEIRNAVRRLVVGAGGSMIRRRMFPDRPDLDSTVEEPEPLGGIRAAASLQFEAGQALARAARYAREDGTSWEQIGEVLYPAGLRPDEESKAVRAFRQIAPSRDPFQAPSFSWTCGTCGKHVSDHGPESVGHPADAERGHTTGCARLAKAVADYDAQWEEEDEPWEDDE